VQITLDVIKVLTFKMFREWDISDCWGG